MFMELEKTENPVCPIISYGFWFMYIVGMRNIPSNMAHHIKSIVQQYDPQAKIYLYGSRAKGTSHESSDWDVLILLSSDSVSSEMERKITSPLYDLELDTGEIISPGIYSQKEWRSKYRVTPYYHNVMREGKLL